MPDDLKQKIKRFIRDHALLRGGEHILVAVSGGADSVALLYVLRELKRRFRLRLTVAHLNHKIRGQAAEEDARFVRRLAHKLALPFAGNTADVPLIARRAGISLEMAGRQARYSFFEKTARKRGCDIVATAHTADDNAETILLMLARGCGLQGLTGIAPSSQIGKTTVIRPFLGIERRAIERYLRGRNIAWREDVSNADPAFLRNRVRHELLPLLETKYNKGIRRALINLADVLRGENEFMDALAAAAYAEACDESGRVLNCAIAAKHHSAVRRRVLRHWLKTNGIDIKTIDFQLINRIDKLIMESESRGKISMAGELTVRKNYSCLTIESVAESIPEPTLAFGHPSVGGELSAKGRSACGGENFMDKRLRSPPGRGAQSAGWVQRRQNKTYLIKIKFPGTTLLPGSGLCVKAKIGPGVCRERGAFGRYPARASLSLKKWRRRIILARSWRPGDRMRPYGLAGSKKIQDIFSDAKFPAVLRRRLPIFECGGEIIWIPGYRIAEGWQVPGAAAKALHLRVE